MAIEVFCYRLAGKILAMCAGLKRLDALVFTGGIGENSALVRKKAVDRLGVLSLRLDHPANEDAGKGSNGVISLPATPLILVVPTDEELMIARDAVAFISRKL